MSYSVENGQYIFRDQNGKVYSMVPKGWAETQKGKETLTVRRFFETKPKENPFEVF